MLITFLVLMQRILIIATSTKIRSGIYAICERKQLNRNTRLRMFDAYVRTAFRCTTFFCPSRRYQSVEFTRNFFTKYMSCQHQLIVRSTDLVDFTK